MIAIAMVAKTFGTYASMMMGSYSSFWANLYSIGILLSFVVVNLAGSLSIAKIENIVVVTKLIIITVFTVVVFFYIDPKLLSLKGAPPVINVFSAIALTFFAYEGFRVK